MSDKLRDAIAAIQTAPKQQIGNKQYSKVATRVEFFRLHFGIDYGLTTELLDEFDHNLVRVKATITDPTGRAIATGLAEEDRRNGRVNQTSAVENAETSAIGRALAALGLAGGEYASDIEMLSVFEGVPDEREMVRPVPQVQAGLPSRQVPKAVPRTGLYIPNTDLDLTWNNPHPEADHVMSAVSNIEQRDQLASYWNELETFRGLLGKQVPDRLSELKAAFQQQFDYVEIPNVPR